MVIENCIFVKRNKDMAGEKRTEIQELGEFGLIKRINEKNIVRNKSTIKAIGDDAAVIDGGEEAKLVTTDFLIEGVHFDLTYTPLKHLGFKAIAVNVSDIAAMNAIAEQVTVSIAVSNRISVEAIDEFYQGVQAACEAYGVDLIGGDTTSSTSGFIISVTAIGKAKKESIAYRSKAKEGQVICVTGDIGGAYIGLQLLEREKQVFLSDGEMQPQLEKYSYPIQRLLKPEARMDIIHELAELGVVPTSMMDISDGLASEILHICTQSKIGAKIFDTQLPIDTSVKEAAIDIQLDPSTAAMNGGEDYELLFTVTQEDFEKMKNLPDVVAVGITTKKEDGVLIVTASGRAYPIEAQGWKHF